MIASCFAADWPPTTLAGAWIVDSTSVDGDPDVERGNLALLLIGEHLILAESFPDNAMPPYADALRLSDGKRNEDRYTAMLHLPAIGPSCFSVGHDKSQAVITFTMNAINGNDRLTVALKGVNLEAKRLGHAAARSRIQTLLREPELDCDKDTRTMLIKYVASQSKPSTDEPCDATEPGLCGFTNGNSTSPAR
ncbi:hypothetical protein [Rubripirellula lacrimiformis]|nr:hypothetical protein [Rubripirellula lacrimiformis]